MSQNIIDWKVVHHPKSHRPIGCVGYIAGRVAAVGAFYDHRDANFDGKVSLWERVPLGTGATSKKIQPLLDVVSFARVAADFPDDIDTLLELERILGMQRMLAPLMDFGFLSAKAITSMTVGGAIARRIPAGAVTQFLVRQAFGRAVDKYIKTVVLPAAGSHSGLKFEGGLIGASS